MQPALCPQSSRAAEHSEGHVTHRSADLAADRSERRSSLDLLPEASLQRAGFVAIGILAFKLRDHRVVPLRLSVNRPWFDGSFFL